VYSGVRRLWGCRDSSAPAANSVRAARFDHGVGNVDHSCSNFDSNARFYVHLGVVSGVCASSLLRWIGVCARVQRHARRPLRGSQPVCRGMLRRRPAVYCPGAMLLGRVQQLRLHSRRWRRRCWSRQHHNVGADTGFQRATSTGGRVNDRRRGNDCRCDGDGDGVGDGDSDSDSDSDGDSDGNSNCGNVSNSDTTAANQVSTGC
jgi:hypothetical protein